jgi:hypothetical protein
MRFAAGAPLFGQVGSVAFARPSPRRRCWSDRLQTSQQEVSEGFGVAHASEASNCDQLATEHGLQTFVAAKIDWSIVSFDRCQRSVKSPFQDLSV